MFSFLYTSGASFLSSFISAAEHQDEAATMIEICGDAEVKKVTFEAVRIGRDEPLEFLQVSYLILSWSKQTSVEVIHASCMWKLDHSAGASYVKCKLT